MLDRGVASCLSCKSCLKNSALQQAQEKAFMEVFNMKLEQVDQALKKHAKKI